MSLYSIFALLAAPVTRIIGPGLRFNYAARDDTSVENILGEWLSGEFQHAIESCKAGQRLCFRAVSETRALIPLAWC